MARIHFIECDFGKLGKAFVERDSGHTDAKSILDDIKSGQFQTPIIRILALDMVSDRAGIAEDVTREFGDALFNWASARGPFRHAPEVAQELMRRAGHDIHTYDDENDENDRLFEAELSRRTGEDRATFALYGEVA